MAARLNRRHQEFVREKIRASQIINRLEDHILTDLELTSTQVTAALGLLKKIVPDLSSVEMQATVENVTNPTELSTEELLNIAAAGGAGSAEKESGAGEPSSIH